MRKYIITLTLFINALGFGQGQPEINAKLPDMIPPSPSVAALMKFEEVPVNYYTGVPDISVPLFSINPSGVQVGLNLALKYHTNSTKIKEKASDVGLGWSLVGAGSVSRTVKGIPDEFYHIGKQKYGIYRSNPVTGTNYYSMLNKYDNLPSMGTDVLQEYLFEVDRAGMYDTSHDLWQYNFMGHSGRFFIEKSSTGALEVKSLDNNILKIVNHYVMPGTGINVSEDYKPTGFTIYDDYGYRYVFNVVETTLNSSFSETEAHNGLTFMSITSDITFNSAFHLKEVYDNNNVLLFDFAYTNPVTEHITSSNVITTSTVEQGIGVEQNEILFGDGCEPSLFSKSFITTTLYEPKTNVSSNTMIYGSKKLLSITIPRYGTLNFNYQIGRQDENYVNRAQALILKSISQSDMYGNEIKKIELSHSHRNALSLKLFLDEVKETVGTSNVEVRKFHYKETMTDMYSATADGWGYLKKQTLFNSGVQADKDEVSAFALEKMILPTGGCVVFKYEPNIYSYIGNELIENFDENFYNWNNQTNPQTIFQLNQSYSLFTITNTKNKVSLSMPSTITNINDWWLRIYKDGVEYNAIIGDYCNVNQLGQCVRIYENLPIGTYTVKLTTPQIGVTLQSPFQVMVNTSTIKTLEEGYKNYFYGGGYRISRILTFEEDVNLNYFGITPLTEKNFSYLFTNTNNSSGSLCSMKPMKYYQMSKRRPKLGLSCGIIIPERTVTYNYFTNGDFINRSTTQGSEVGYKNVTVNEGVNGYTQYTYTSPIDYPDIHEQNGLFFGPPLFLPSINMDYKRGVLEKKEVFDSNGRMLTLEENQYSFEEYNSFTGFQVYGLDAGNYVSSPTYKLFSSYNQYNTARNSQICFNPQNFSYCKIDEGNFIYESFVKAWGYKIGEFFGWVKLNTKKTKNLYYEGSAQRVIEVIENFNYNAINKKANEHIVTTSLVGDTKKIKYHYHNGNSIHSQNRISEIEKIETYRGAELLSTSKINYVNTFAGNVSYLPETIQASKGSDALENKLRYVLYDEFSNPLQVQNENGMKISYIWGYNKTQPVAKLENIAYSSIPASLITGIQSATDSPTSTEQDVLNALSDLYNSSDANLQKAMITTLTYIPLVGVSTITDPKGQLTRYEYDNFNRLMRVSDSEGNPLTETEYHYRNQN